jgi:hypothetical protein
LPKPIAGVIIYDKPPWRDANVPWYDFLWLDGEEGNLEHIAEHGLTPDDVEHVVKNFIAESVSHSSGRPIRFGFTPDGKYIAVVFEWIDDVTVYPITAYELED